ncbi:hypothetical protein DXG01_013653 [Tephrocybe rancida]|nr:hypothetical protein DXG01_013653 [Tephrocybe rancida]
MMLKALQTVVPFRLSPTQDTAHHCKVVENGSLKNIVILANHSCPAPSRMSTPGAEDYTVTTTTMTTTTMYSSTRHPTPSVPSTPRKAHPVSAVPSPAKTRVASAVASPAPQKPA